MPWLDGILAGESRIRPGSPIAYAIAAGLVGIALGLRVALEGWVTVPYMIFFPAVIVAVFIGGLGAGLGATALSALCAWYVLLPPAFAAGGKPVPSALVLFEAVSVVNCAIVASFQRAATRRRAARTRALEAANLDLRRQIAERETAEHAARQAQKMEAIGQLTGGVAHDFNNLLTVIFGNLDALRVRYGEREPTAARLIDGAMRGAERAASLTQRLLAFSRRQMLEPASIDVNELVRGLSETMRRCLGGEIGLETALAGGLWRALCDPHQLEIALLNLVINARDAMPGGGTLIVETANASLDAAYAAAHDQVAAGDYVELAITDTGEGMSSDVAAKAFEPFFTTRQSGHGAGLGLSMVYGFVAQSDGHVTISSAPGHGTTVRLYLPRLSGA